VSEEGKPLASRQGMMLIQVTGEDPITAPPAMFSNFLGIARVANDVQLEFVFLDLNQVVQIINAGQEKVSATPPTFKGQTVAKIIMPASAFVQLKEHLAKLMADIEKEMGQLGEAQNASTNDRRATGT
jgi:hypothetical protein